jgi:hypothetical protein
VDAAQAPSAAALLTALRCRAGRRIRQHLPQPGRSPEGQMCWPAAACMSTNRTHIPHPGPGAGKAVVPPPPREARTGEGEAKETAPPPCGVLGVAVQDPEQPASCSCSAMPIPAPLVPGKAQAPWYRFQGGRRAPAVFSATAFRSHPRRPCLCLSRDVSPFICPGPADGCAAGRESSIAL